MLVQSRHLHLVSDYRFIPRKAEHSFLAVELEHCAWRARRDTPLPAGPGRVSRVFLKTEESRGGLDLFFENMVSALR